MSHLVLRDVEKSFDGKQACTDINLTINKGEFFTFLGPSGCGKTTILRLIAGFIKPENGSIQLDSRDITGLAPEKRKVGMVFQNYALFPHLNVYQNIEYGLTVQKKTNREKESTIARYMELIGLKGFEHRSISELSGGEQQRVAIARSLVIEPKVLLLDEPLSNLDAKLRDKMRMEIKSLQKRLKITTVFVTHDQFEAMTLSDRVAVFNQGRIEQIGSPDKIYSTPENSFIAGFIGETNLLKAVFKDKKVFLSDNFFLELTGTDTKGTYISIRPQDIIISKVKPEKSNTFKGRLKENQFNGIWIDYIVNANGIDFKVASLNTAKGGIDIQPGDSLFISIPEKCIQILDN